MSKTTVAALAAEVESLRAEITALKDELALMREARYEAQRAAPKQRTAWVDPQADLRSAYREFVQANRKPGAVLPGFAKWCAEQHA